MMTENGAWSGFSAFQVFGDHLPMAGFVLVIRLCPEPGALARLLEERSSSSRPLDPELAQATVRAGVGLMQTGAPSFVYANSEEAVAVLKPQAVSQAGESLDAHDHLVSVFAGRLALTLGQSLPVHGQVFEFPEVGVVRRAVVRSYQAHHEASYERSSRRLLAQLRAKAAGPSAMAPANLDEQTALLQQNGVDVEKLPGWWWGGIAARNGAAGVEVFDEITSGDELASLIV